MKNLRLNVSKFLWFVFLLFIPTQLGKHFWPDWASVQGVRVDYLSPTVYFLDIIFVCLLVFNFKIKTKNGWKLLILGLVLALNLILAWNKWEAGYKILRILEWGWVFFYVKENKEISQKFLKIIIPIWLILESTLGLIQVSLDRSVGGWGYWWGERAMNLNTLGVAKWSILGTEHLRAYGTFSHPNSLAGFLLVVILLWWGLIKKKDLFFWMVWWLGIMGMIICGSRNVWLVGLLILIYSLYKKNKWYLVSVPFLMGIAIWNFNWFSGWDPTSWKKRWELMISAILMIKESLFLGVGAGNFLVRLPEYKANSPIFWLQPVHNIYLLLVSELGVLGVMVLIWISKIKKINYWPLIAILLTGLFDHYWVTLPQNAWLAVLVLGLI